MLLELALTSLLKDFPETSRTRPDHYLMRNRKSVEMSQSLRSGNAFYESDPEELIYLYKQHSFVLGQEVSLSQNNTDYKGLARDVSDSGQLVQLDNGQEIWLNSSEVSLSSW